MHDEDDSIHNEDESSEKVHITEAETYTDNGDQNNVKDNKLITTNFEVKVVNRKSKDSEPIQQINKQKFLELILELIKVVMRLY